MKAHNGMRPQDIVILLKIITFEKNDWQQKDLASELFISLSEVSDSLNRSEFAGLIDHSKRRVRKKSFQEFMIYGLQFVFPQIPGSLVLGVPTAHSHPYFREQLIVDTEYVWPDLNGTTRGLAVQPLHKGVPRAVLKDKELYEALAAIDILRVGNAREKNLACSSLYRILK